ncbi:class I SAM-dependent methyltransferase [Rhodoblastus sp.]|uniref:class I SAM-dependent methyltransferase n=1 Tax=Rhodoblastus sp. TaxID=1962975 RepID=UPI003F971096
MSLPFVEFLSDIGMNRIEFVLSQFTKDQKLLEIGGSYNPILHRTDGLNMYTVDHDTQDNLIAHYTRNNLSLETISNIQRVDFVVQDGNLDGAIPDEHLGTFDFCISSHNIEHIPNPVAHLRSIRRLLSEKGSFLMVVPDKRGCFDLLRPLTSTGQWLAAYIQSAPFHSLSAIYDTNSIVVANHREVTWRNGEVFDHLEMANGNPLKDIYELISKPATAYTDAHAWVFTPHSMLLILCELNALGLTGLYPNRVLSDGGGEFIVELIKSEPVQISHAARLSLLARACREQAEAHMRIVIA